MDKVEEVASNFRGAGLTWKVVTASAEYPRYNQAIHGSGTEEEELVERTTRQACDWSLLQADLLTRILSGLEIPDLISSGAVCRSWNTSYSTVRHFNLCSPGKAHYLLYHSQEDEDSREPCKVTLRRITTGKSYRIPVPASQPRTSRYTVGSSHGWIVTADDLSELRLFNPVTGAHIGLPPLHKIDHVEYLFKDNNGSITVYGNAVCNITPSKPKPRSVYEQRHIARMAKYSFKEARQGLCKRVILSADPCQGDKCIVMLIHHPQAQLSYARIGDDQWTWLTANKHCCAYHDCFFDDNDGFFYALRRSGEIQTIDFRGNETSPLVLSVFPPIKISPDCTKYIVRAPWGDLLQVWRYFEIGEVQEPKTRHVTVFKSDIANQELTKIKDLRGHALFVGFDSSFFASVEDFPVLSPNCVFLAHDNCKCDLVEKPILKEVVIYNIQSGSFVDIPPSLGPWMNCPPPIWIKLSCSQDK